MTPHRQKIARAGAIIASAALLAVPLAGQFAGASSHREAPKTSKDPTIDNTDVYAFVSPDDRSKVTLLSNWIPFQEPAGGPNFYQFDDNAEYFIKVDIDGDAQEDISYRWTFKEEFLAPDSFLYNNGPVTSVDDENFLYRQRYTVTEITSGSGRFGRNRDRERVLVNNVIKPPDNVGPRSTPNYEQNFGNPINGPDGIKIFTGQRDEHFFIDLGSFFDLLGLRPFNNVHIITPPNTAAGVDGFSGFNITTTAIQVPIRQLAPDCPVNNQGIPTNDAQDDKRCVIGVWSSSERRSGQVVSGFDDEGTDLGGRRGDRSVQVSRLGHPLINEVVIPLGRKDKFNSSHPNADAQFLPAVLNSEVAKLINLLYPATQNIPETGRVDLVTVFLTGIPADNPFGAPLTQQEKSLISPSEQLRLNVAIPPNGNQACNGNRLGVLGGDEAGFPNGRRLEDDVVDIEIRVIAGALLDPPLGAPNNLLGDGVDANDVPCKNSFPYMGTPHSGYSHEHDHEEGN